MRAARGAAGLGLVELMVGLALGLLVVAAAGLMFQASHQAARSTEALSQVQESVRTSHELLARELREAGGTLCDPRIPVVNDIAPPGPAWFAAWGAPVQGFGGADGGFPGAAFGTGPADRLAGTDALVLRYVSDVRNLTVVAHNPAAASFTVNAAAPGVAAGEVLMVCNYGQGAIFVASAVGANQVGHAVGAGNASAALGLPPGTPRLFDAGSRIGRLVGAGWYIGHNGRGGRSLYRVDGAGTQEVAEGVIGMRVDYLDASGVYRAAAAVGDWASVTAARVVLTLESARDHVSTDAAASRLQRTVSFTVQLRNLG